MSDYLRIRSDGESVDQEINQHRYEIYGEQNTESYEKPLKGSFRALAVLLCKDLLIDNISHRLVIIGLNRLDPFKKIIRSNFKNIAHDHDFIEIRGCLFTFPLIRLCILSAIVIYITSGF